MGQLNFASRVLSSGYEEISEEDCPVIPSDIRKRRDMLYFRKGSLFAMCNKSGYFLIWDDDTEHEALLSWRRPVFQLMDNRKGENL